MKKILLMILLGTMACSMVGCKNNQIAEPNNNDIKALDEMQQSAAEYFEKNKEGLEKNVEDDYNSFLEPYSWEDFNAEFVFNGTKLSWPFTVNDIVENGYYTDDVLDSMFPDDNKPGSDVIFVYRAPDDKKQLFHVDIRKGKDEKNVKYKNATIEEISQSKHYITEVNDYQRIIFPGGMKVYDKLTEKDLIKKLGDYKERDVKMHGIVYKYEYIDKHDTKYKYCITLSDNTISELSIRMNVVHL